MKLLNLCNVYSVYDVNATVWFTADCIIILCETVVKCMMFSTLGISHETQLLL